MANNMKVVVFGQVNRTNTYSYTYPDRFDPLHPTNDDEWLRSVIDPHDARALNCAEVFTMWKSQQGNFYGIIVPSPDSPGERLILAVYTGKQKATDAKVAVQVLRDLSQLIILADIKDDVQVGLLLEPLEKVLEEDTAAPISTGSFQKCYCTYDNDDDVADVFANIGSAMYSDCKRLFIVPTEIAKSAAAAGFVEKVQPKPAETEMTYTEEKEEEPEEVSTTSVEPEDDNSNYSSPEPPIAPVQQHEENSFDDQGQRNEVSYAEPQASTQVESPTPSQQPTYPQQQSSPVQPQPSQPSSQEMYEAQLNYMRSNNQRKILLVIIAILFILLIALIAVLIIFIIQEQSTPKYIYVQ